MQNKFAIIGIAVAAILILGGIGLYLVNNNRSEPQSTQIATSDVNEENPSAQNQTLSMLLKDGGTLQCSFSYEDEENSTSGIVYIDDERMRADVTTNIDGVDSEISMVRKDNKNYIWGSAFPDNTGLLFESNLDEIGTDENYSEYIDIDREGNFSCENWKVTEESFDTPDDVEFNDLSGLVNDIVKEEAGKTACSVCESLEGDAKEACLVSLSC